MSRRAIRIEIGRPVAQVVFFAALVAVSALSLASQDQLPTVVFWIEISDKSLHAGAYAVLALLAVPAFEGRYGVATLAGALVAWGGLLEAAQSLVPDRTPEWLDVAANAAGVALALGVLHLARRGAGGRGSPT